MRTLFLKFTRNGYLCLSMLISLGYALYMHRQELTNPYIVYPDCHFYYFLYGLFDYSLFQNDLLMQSYIRHPLFFVVSMPFAKPIVPIEALLTRFFDISRIITGVSIAYNMIAAFLVFKIGEIFKDKKSAVTLVILFLLYFSTMETFFGGGVRGIGAIICCLIFYGLCRSSIAVSLSAVSLSFVFYSLLLPLTVIVSSLQICASSIKRDKKIKYFILLGLIIFAITLFIYLLDWRSFDALTNAYRWKTVLKSKAGFESSFIGRYVFNFNERSTMYQHATFFFIAANLFLWRIKRRRFAFSLSERLFVLAALGAFFICLFMNKVIASRQLIFALPLLLVVSFWRMVEEKINKANRILLVLAVAAFLVFLKFENRTKELFNLSDQKQKMEYLSALKKDALILAYPESATFISFYSRRSVYFNRVWERIIGPCAICLESDRDELRKREQLSLALYYAPSLQAIINDLEASGITHIVVEEYYYKDYLKGPVEWYQSYKENALQIIAKTRPRDGYFPLLFLAEKYGKMVGKGSYVLDAEFLRSLLKTDEFRRKN